MILGTISEITSGQGVSLVIDGEESATTMKYSFLSSYRPTAGDRVLIEEIGDTYVVIGKIVATPAADYAAEAGHADTADSADSAVKATGDGDGNTITSFYGHALQAGATDDVVQLVDSAGNVLSSVTVNHEVEAQGVKNWFTTGYSASAYSIEFKTDVGPYTSANKLYWRARSGSGKGSWKEL